MNINKVKKVLELAKNGIAGEREAAQATLEKMLKKYNITIEQLEQPNEYVFTIKFYGKFEKSLLIQIMASVIGKKELRGKIIDNQIKFVANQMDYIETHNQWDFYLPLFKTELKKHIDVF
jgi:hypothetical protein